MTKRSRTLLALLFLAVAVTIMSLTLGRALVSDRSPGLGSFALIHFAGYLFFLLMPVEVLVPFYLAEGHAGMLLIALAVVTAIVAQIIDYRVGYAVSGEIIDNLIGHKRYQRARHAIERYGHWAVLLFNLLPLSSPNLLLAAGVTRYSFRKAMLFSAVGLIAKYAAIVYLSWGVWDLGV